MWTSLAFLGGITFLDYLRPSIQSLTGSTSSGDVIASLVGAPSRWTRAWFADEEVPRLHLDIKYKHLHKLHQKRDAAIAIGLLQTASDDFVPAEIRIGERTVRVKLRLKGDYTDHLEGKKWSMRVHVKKKDHLFGMRRFSLQAPQTRAFQAEPIVLDHYRREGILAPRYFFVEVSINGDDIGLMAVEESFGKELLESSGRRAGVIIRFHEDPFFANLVRNGIHGPFENFFAARITPFGSSAIARSRKLSAQLEIATGLLRGFLEGRLLASTVFDVEGISRFLAVSEVWGSTHALTWHNLRFYLNPISMRLEPIAFDINMQVTYVGTGMVTLSAPFASLLLDDPTIRSAFVRNLRRIAEETRDGLTTTNVRKLETPMLDILNREFPLRTAMHMRRIEQRATLLASVTDDNFELFRPELVQPRADYPDALHAYLQRDESGDYLELVNVLSVPLIVDALFHRTNAGERNPPLSLLDSRALPITIPATPLGGRPTPVRVRFESEDGEDNAKAGSRRKIGGRYRVLGQRHHHPFKARPYFAALNEHPIATRTLEETLEQHPFLRMNETTGRLRAAVGDQLVDGSLILPVGIGLELDAGTTLRFREGEALIASGPLVFHGSPESPVVLEGRSTDSLWSGIAVLHSDEAHDWKNVIVRHTSGIARGAWTLTGGVTLRNSRVRIEDSLFESNECEDALNLIHSNFELLNVRFMDTPSDAFDGDFVKGRIVGGSYDDIGGDGIDVSGSEIEIKGVSLSRIHDKALSIGEGSRATITDVRVDHAGTALASKDASHTEITNSRFSQIEFTAIMAYVKKPEYGPSDITARNIEFQNVGRKALAQIGSRIQLNEVEIVPEAVDIEGLYDNGYMRK
jgi:hypothetical protein